MLRERWKHEAVSLRNLTWFSIQMQKVRTTFFFQWKSLKLSWRIRKSENIFQNHDKFGHNGISSFFSMKQSWKIPIENTSKLLTIFLRKIEDILWTQAFQQMKLMIRKGETVSYNFSLNRKISVRLWGTGTWLPPRDFLERQLDSECAEQISVEREERRTISEERNRQTTESWWQLALTFLEILETKKVKDRQCS